MKIKDLEELINQTELLTLKVESEVEYMKDVKAKLEIVTVDRTKEQEKDDQESISKIIPIIAQAEEQLRILNFVLGKYAERLAKERSANIEAEKSS